MNRVKKVITALGCILLFSGCVSTSKQFGLSGTRWILQSMHDQELLEDTAITLKITERGISGSSGCNLYSTTQYTTKPRNRIDINEVAHTEMACVEPVGIMEQEEKYISTIQNAASYILDGEILFILDKQGNILLQYRLLPKFEANPADLIGKTWSLIYADYMEEYELDEFTLCFNGSTYRGTTSCRNYEGIYQSVENSIHFTTMKMTTDVDCVHKDYISESTYTSFFPMIDQYNVSQYRLELYTVKNDKLIYELVSDK